MSQDDWTPDQFWTYKFANGVDTVTLLVPTLSEWDEETVFDVAFADLASHLGVSQYEAQHEWWDDDSWLSTDEEMESMGGIYSHLRNKEN